MQRDLREGRAPSEAEHAGAGDSEMKLSLQKGGGDTAAAGGAVRVWGHMARRDRAAARPQRLPQEHLPQ